MSNIKIIMSKKPIDFPNESNFKIVNEDSSDLMSGEVRLQTLWLSLDPYMRGAMGRIEEGDIMVGELIGQVIESKSKIISEGNVVLSKAGWQTSPIANEKDVKIVDPRIEPLSLALGAIGMPGLTAYFGLTKIGNPQSGETVVVSAGSGAVGSVVGQIAKKLGCKVVGIAGSDMKVDYMTNELGFDHGINYKNSDWIKNLNEGTKDGVDVYFDNVGGIISDKVIDRINEKARVLVCGQISQYNNSEIELGPRNLKQFLFKRAKLEGFMVYTYEDQYKEGLDFLLNMLNKDKLKFRETIFEGIESAPSAFSKLFTGENFGKLIIKVN
ncbi:MAG: NADP-dependent oxidoreductase [Chloroflexi bacterium]|nr:NADP-dependent oxidoreductase [Chloroflexota bacterium]|tara:strand:+ start:1860 stop:2837 length:978 start_codon:yes stop_codon:yes gene_type:complete